MNKLALMRSVYASPQTIEYLDIQQWNQLIKEAYSTGMLARLFYIFNKKQLSHFIPEQALWHFSSAFTFAQAHRQDILIEIQHVKRAFKLSGQEPIFLKGTAYILANDEASEGRIFSDIDVFTPIKALPKIEQLLQWQGWSFGEIDAYDDAYYRKWMHEIPALTHKTRGSTLDVHHNLLPRTSRITFESHYIESKIDTMRGILAEEDRLIHSIVHLFLESEFDKGLRDMTDIDLLFNQYQKQDQNFANRVLSRSFELGVDVLVFYAFRNLKKYLGTKIPDDFTNKISKNAPTGLKLKLMDKLFSRVLFSPQSIDKSAFNKLAHLVMYLRGHYMRMPLHLLIPHLLHKAIVSPINKWKKEEKSLITD